MIGCELKRCWEPDKGFPKDEDNEEERVRGGDFDFGGGGGAAGVGSAEVGTEMAAS